MGSEPVPTERGMLTAKKRKICWEGVLLTIIQLGDYLGSHNSPLQTFRMPNGAADSLIEPIFVGVGNRHEVELEQIPDCFYPFCGKNHIRGDKLSRPTYLGTN